MRDTKKQSAVAVERWNEREIGANERRGGGDRQSFSLRNSSAHNRLPRIDFQ